MTVYLDSTVVMRQLLGVGESWSGWGKWEKAYASTLMRTECCRVANRLRSEGKIDDERRARLGSWIESVCSCITMVPVTDGVLRRASDPFPVDVGTLQGIHLATISELQAAHGVTCAVATDDTTLLKAAECMGFESAFAAAEPAAKKADDGKAAEAAEEKKS